MHKRSLLIALSSILLGGCAIKPNEINGNVFITTKSGECLKLALVPILLFNEEQVKAAVEQAKSTLLLEHKDLNSKLSQIQIAQQKKIKEIESQKDEYDKKREMLSELESRRPRNPQFYPTPNTEVFTTRDIISEPFNINPPIPKQSKYKVDEQKANQAQEVYNLMATKWREEYDMIKDQVNAAQTQVNKSDEEYESIFEECGSTREELQSWNEKTQQRLFSVLPNPVASTKTDADGNFQFKSIPKGRYAIAASTTRTILTKTEKYYWFIYLPQKSRPEDKNSLNNDNLLAVKNTNSVVQIPIVSY